MTDSMEQGTFTDPRDKRVYKTVKIGNQVWLAENLNYNTSAISWAYENDESNTSIYGRLYDWETALDACPPGWHIPTDTEWEELMEYIGNRHGYEKYDDYWEEVADHLKSTSGWKDGGNGKDTYGFSALPGAGRDYEGDFDYAGCDGFWWSSTESGDYNAWYRNIRYNSTMVNRGDNLRKSGYSIRCIRDKTNN